MSLAAKGLIVAALLVGGLVIGFLGLRQQRYARPPYLVVGGLNVVVGVAALFLL